MTYQRSPVRRTWARLSPGQRVLVLIAGPLVLCCGGATALGAVLNEPPAPASPSSPSPSVPSPSPPPSASPPPLLSSPQPVVQKRKVQETRAIPFKTRTVTDSSMDKGTKEVREEGVAGVRTLTYEITVTDGRQTAKRLLSNRVTTPPTTRLIAVGTREDAPECDPNYAGGCVPVDSDVDCAGGRGNGPSYVDGVVEVVGTDIYDLDRDNDGFGCD